MKEDEKKCKCDCHEEHNCGCAEGKECTCGDDCQCGDSCTCHEGDSCKGQTHSHCEDNCECGHCDCGCDDECNCHNEDIANQYLAMAQRLQADFDNYRRRVAEQLDYQRNEGVKSVIEVFLPCVDTFKEAKKNISDENVLSGINMIEDKILNALKTLHVEKIEAVGQIFDHNLHEAIANYSDESKDEDVILDEFQSGWTLNGKVIRYSKVIVNKKGE